MNELVKACQTGNLLLVKTLMTYSNCLRDDDGNTILHLISSRTTQASIIEYLIENWSDDINKQNNFHYTPLIMACFSGDLPMVNMLTKADNIRYSYALYAACYRNHVTVARLLLDRMPADNINKCNRNNKSPLYIACVLGHILVVKLLLADPRVDVNQKCTGKNWTALYNMAYVSNRYTVHLILQMRPDAVVEPGCITRACRFGKYDKEVFIKQVLLTKIPVGSDIKCEGTALFRRMLSKLFCRYYIGSRYIDVFKYLLNRSDVDINTSCYYYYYGTYSPLGILAEYNYYDLIVLLLRRPDLIIDN